LTFCFEQKTGNAIRALGRLATLSASRKNLANNAAAAAAAQVSSPRPSISGTLYNNLNNHVNDSRMTSVNEDEEIANHSSPLHASNDKCELKLKDIRSCNERSDSGFSECSNCSTPSASCVCNLTLLDKAQSIIEEQSNSSSSSNEPEETTESIQPETEEKTATADESFTVSSDHDIRSEISSLEYDDANKSPCDDNQNVVVSIRVPTRRELFQDEHGDLLSEIQRRKVSLENTAKKTSSSFKHEVSLEKLKKTSKVALLMEKFEASSCQLPSYQTKSTAVTNGLNTNQAFDNVNVKSFDVPSSPVDEENNIFESSHFTAKSKSPTRNATNPTTFRLSNRVREVTERLSRTKQQTSLEDSPTRNSIFKQDSSTFVRSKDFWKR
jgi:hypothetical protein